MNRTEFRVCEYRDDIFCYPGSPESFHPKSMKEIENAIYDDILSGDEIGIYESYEDALKNFPLNSHAHYVKDDDKPYYFVQMYTIEKFEVSTYGNGDYERHNYQGTLKTAPWDKDLFANSDNAKDPTAQVTPNETKAPSDFITLYEVWPGDTTIYSPVRIRKSAIISIELADYNKNIKSIVYLGDGKLSYRVKESPEEIMNMLEV